jgi:hypothetical protein
VNVDPNCMTAVVLSAFGAGIGAGYLLALIDFLRRQS